MNIANIIRSVLGILILNTIMLKNPNMISKTYKYFRDILLKWRWGADKKYFLKSGKTYELFLYKFIKRKYKDDCITLKKGENIFGRDEKIADFIIEDPCISKKHFVILVNENKQILIDCSKNGIYLNNIKLSKLPRVLKEGDEIQVSDIKFIVH